MPRKATSRPPTNRVAPPSRSSAIGTPTDARWFEITNLAESSTAEIRLRGYIGQPQYDRDWYSGEMVRGVGAGTLQEFEAELNALGDVRDLTVSIFSEGGEVFTGMAIANLLQRHPASKVCIIDGICASAATYIALACDEVRIPSNAWMMIHGSSGCCCGGPEEMRSYAGMLDQINGTAINLYVARTGKSEAEIATMLATETWMNGKTAVENGFADTVIEPLQNLAARAGTLQPTNSVMLRTAPAEVLALFDMTRTSYPSPTMKIRTPLMNAASDPAAPAAGAQAGVPAVTAPAVVPATPAVTPPAVTPPTNAVVSPVAPTAPTNVIQLTQEQLQTMMTQAATNAVAPLQAELNRISGLNAAGITPQNLAGAPPVAGAAPVNEGPKALTADEMQSMSPMQLINHGRKQLAASGKTIPLQS